LGQVLQTGLQLFDSFFGGAIFVDQGHDYYLMCVAGWQGDSAAIIVRVFHQVNIKAGLFN
jgi:hypothetical protein